MNKYKLIAFDIDGTTLPYGQEEFSSTIKSMFSKLKNKGYKIAICTGREMITIGSLLDNLEIDYFLGANAAFIYDWKAKKMLEENTISYQEFEKLYDFLIEYNVDISVMTNKYGYFSPGHDFNNWFLQKHVDKFKTVKELKKTNENLHIITIKTDNPNIIKITEKFLVDEKMNISINSQWTKGFFISPKSINKARGLEKLGNILNIGLDEMMAFGDSSNDFEMLSEVGLGIAMENASSEIKKAAKEIGYHVNDDGVYKKLVEMKILNND